MPRVPCVISSRSPSSTALLGPLDDRLRRQQALDSGGDLLVCQAGLCGFLPVDCDRNDRLLGGKRGRDVLDTIDGLHLGVDRSRRGSQPVEIGGGDDHFDLVGREASVSGRHGDLADAVPIRRLTHPHFDQRLIGAHGA
jgi:hypothetical protein